MTKPVAYQGVLTTGPLAAQKTRVHTSPRLPAEGGFYVWMMASGPAPATWRWVPEKKDAKK